MSNDVSNADIYSVLLGIKEDIGGLKNSADTHFEALKNHGNRINLLEEGAARQKGAAKVWTLVGSTIGAALGAGVAVATAWIKR